MGLQLDLLTVNGAGHIAKLPKATDVATMDEINGDGQLSFTVAAASSGAAALLAADEALVRVSLDGEPIAHGVLDRDGDDPTAGDARTITVTAPGTAVILADSITYPSEPGGTVRSFTTATPGFVMSSLLLEGQGRGGLQGISWSFTDLVDSAGTAWPQKWTADVEVGTTVRTVLASLVEQRLVDFRMEGLRLELYVADTALRRDRPNVTLLAQWLQEAERERARQGKVTHMLGLGDGGRTATAVSNVPGRRREASAQIGGIPDQGTLQLATEAALAPVSKVQQGYTTSYVATRDRPRPWSSYRPGDSIRRGDIRLPTGELEPLRVTSMSVSLNDDGATEVTLELNDVFLEAEVANKIRLDALTNGSVVGRPSARYGVDTTKPAPPASVQITSDAYVTGYGTLAAQATASWPKVTTNHDGTPTTDVAGYEVQWNVNGDGFGAQISRTTAQQMSRDSLPLGSDFFAPATIQVRVRTVDTTGNYSDWRVSATIALAKDTAPPPKPSKPVTTSQLGLITVGWDGKAFDGGAMPADTAAVEVWQSTVQGFTVGAANSSLVGQIRANGGELAIRGTTYGQLIYVKLRPVDNSRNYGPVSEESVASRQYVVGPDVFEGAIGTSKLADLAVITAKIGDLAVNNAKIADLAVGSAKIYDLTVDKLTGGFLNAGVLLSGNIVAGDPFGARVTFDSTGIKAFRSNGQESIRIVPDTSSFETGVQGGARVKISSANNPFQSGQQWGLIEFYSGNGLWSPGLAWAVFTDSRGLLRLASPYLTSRGAGAAATLDLDSSSSGVKTFRADASSYYFGSGGSSIDFNLRDSSLFQLIYGSGERLNFQLGATGTGFGAAQISSLNPNNTPRQLGLSGSDIYMANPTARTLRFGAAFNAQASPAIIDTGAKIGIAFRNTKLGQNDTDGTLEVVGEFGTDLKTIRAWTFVSGSDVSWKDKIEDAPVGMLDEILAIRPVHYGVKGFDPKRRRTRGLLAQDVRAAIPYGTKGDESDDSLGVDHYVLLTTLVGAVQELAAAVLPAKAGAGR